MTINRSISKAIFAVSLTALCLVTGYAAAEDITVKHAQGTTVLPAKPSRVVTFDLSTLDTLDKLGIAVAGVPTVKLPDYLSKYGAANVAKVGSLFEPDYEAVASIKPDLIIVAGRSAAKFNDLAKIAPTIDLTTDSAGYLKSAEHNVEILGEIFGKQAEATSALDRLTSSTAELKGVAAGAGKGLLVLTTGGRMSTFGPGSRFGVLFDDFGVLPADADIKIGMHGQPASFEYVLEKNPDWLFVIDRDAAIGQEGNAASKFLDNEIVARTSAAKQGHIVYLNAASWYLVGGGLTSMQNTVDQLLTTLKKT